MAYTCTFALFLRSVAQCMDSRWHVRMVDLFLSFFVPLAMASVYLAYKLLTSENNVLSMALLVGVGWIACFVYWLVMIVLVRHASSRPLNASASQWPIAPSPRPKPPDASCHSSRSRLPGGTLILQNQ